MDIKQSKCEWASVKPSDAMCRTVTQTQRAGMTTAEQKDRRVGSLEARRAGDHTSPIHLKMVTCSCSNDC